MVVLELGSRAVLALYFLIELWLLLLFAREPVRLLTGRSVNTLAEVPAVHLGVWRVLVEGQVES